MERQYVWWHTAAGCLTALGGSAVGLWVVCCLMPLPWAGVPWALAVGSVAMFTLVFWAADRVDRWSARNRGRKHV